MPKQRYREGDWFAVPLGDGAYALGRIARHARGIVFAYFFGPPLDHVPTLAETAGRRADEASTQMLLSHLGLRDGEWPVLGQDEWERDAWPMVEFERRVDDAVYAVTWDEDDLSELASSRRVDSSEAGARPRDALAGTGAAIVRLRQELGL